MLAMTIAVSTSGLECLSVSMQHLLAVKGMSDAKADKMIEAARKLTQVGAWMTGADALLKVRSRGNRAEMGC
jgi:mevalonate kinase